MGEQKLKVNIFASNLGPTQRGAAEKEGINLSDPNHLIIMIPNKGFSLKQTNKLLSGYNNGLLRMMIENIIKKQPAGSMVVNDNIPEKIKSFKKAGKRGRKPKSLPEA